MSRLGVIVKDIRMVSVSGLTQTQIGLNFEGYVREEGTRSLPKILRIFLAIMLIGVTTPGISDAHPLDEFYQVTFISVGAERVDFTVELYPGALVAPRILALLDADSDEKISEAEVAAYAELVVNELVLEVDDVAAFLSIDRVEVPPLLEIRAGVGVIRLFLQADLSAGAGRHQLFYENNHFADEGVYIVNTL